MKINKPQVSGNFMAGRTCSYTENLCCQKHCKKGIKVGPMEVRALPLVCFSGTEWPQVTAYLLLVGPQTFLSEWVLHVVLIDKS